MESDASSIEIDEGDLEDCMDGVSQENDELLSAADDVEIDADMLSEDDDMGLID